MISKEDVRNTIQAIDEFVNKAEDHLSLADYGYDSTDLTELIEALEELINDELGNDFTATPLENEPLFERSLEDITIAEIIELVQKITR